MDFWKRLFSGNRGQTLVEIIVVVGVVVILTTGLVIVTTFSLKMGRIGRLKSQAVKYAQEGMEFVRQRRDQSWEDFRTLDGIWCLGDGGGWSQAAICLTNVDNFFGRTVEFTWKEDEQRMDVTVTVDWNEGSDYYETHLDSYFTQWQ